MRRLSSFRALHRRRFLQLSLTGASSLALGACLDGRGDVNSAEEVEALQALATRKRLPDRPRVPRESRVALVRPAAFPSHREAIEGAIALAGGLGFIEAGQRVLLKPALNSGNRYPATTDPETVWVVAEMVKQAGGEPFVADRTMFLRSTETAFRKTGIRDAAAQAGVPCLSLEDDPAVALHHPLAEHWSSGKIRVYRSVAEADHLINLCTPRTHKLGDFTMSMKNNVGVVNGPSRLPMHVPWGLKERLAEIGLVVPASLIVMDGREGFSDGGPDAGDLARTGFIAAGTDPVALDALGLAQLRLAGANETISGRSIWELPMMRRAVEIGLGVGSGPAVALVGVDAATEAALHAQMA
jgi:uncharacterized protein (DUF362 family)